MKLRVLIPMFCLAVSMAFAQKSQWEMKPGTEIYNPILSKNGNYLIYFTDDDIITVNCVNVADGSKAWSRELKEFEQYYIARFLGSGNDTLMIGQENRYEFLNARDGSVIKTLPIAGEDWSDMKWEYRSEEDTDTLRPFFKNNVGIFYFSDGTQFIDLRKLEIIYQTTDVPSKVKHKEWESVVMVNPLGGGDSIYFIETMEGRLAYKASKYDEDINSSVYQPFAVSNNEILLFNEENIQSIDFQTGKQNAKIEVDPDDPEFYTPVIFKKGLYLIVSDEGIQKLYSTKDGKLMWQTTEKAIPGIAEQLVELPNDEALLMAYEPDGKMVLYKINSNTGAKLWSRELFMQDGSLETGHKQGSKVWATIGKVALHVLAAAARNAGDYRYGRSPYTGQMGYYRDPFSSSLRRDREYRQDIQRANEMYNSWINTKKSTEGYTYLLTNNDKQVILATAGKIYSIKDGKPSENYDGEGILTLNLADGSVANWSKCDLLAKSESGDFNAFKDLNIQKVDSVRFLLGVHDIQIVQDDKVQTMTFGEDILTYINTNVGANQVTVMANHDNEYYDYWRIDASKVPAQKYLLARATNQSVVFHDSAAVTTMLNITDESVRAYPVKAGDVTDASFASPKWTLTEDDLDKLDLGDFNEKLNSDDRIQGVRIAGGDVFIMGDARIGFISADGSCRWTQEWEPNRLQTKLGLTTKGTSVIYSSGDRTLVMKNQCPPQVVSNNEIGYSDTIVLVSEDNRAVVIDTDEGIVRGYSLN